LFCERVLGRVPEHAVVADRLAHRGAAGHAAELADEAVVRGEDRVHHGAPVVAGVDNGQKVLEGNRGVRGDPVPDRQAQLY
jgi:hypothetical protein